MAVYVSQNPLYLEQERSRRQQAQQQQNQQSMNPRQIQNIMDKIMNPKPGPENNWGGGNPLTEAEYNANLYGGSEPGASSYLGDMTYGVEGMYNPYMATGPYQGAAASSGYMDPILAESMAPEVMGGTEAGLGGAEVGAFGGESAGSSAAGSGGAIAGYVLAAILAQLAASNNTDFEFEGQKTGNVFSGIHLEGEKEDNWDPHFATEPWYAWAQSGLFGDDRLPTAGEKFDAAVANDDNGLALKRLPAAGNYWANPVQSWIGFDTFQNVLGEDLAGVVDPLGWVFSKIEDWF